MLLFQTLPSLQGEAPRCNTTNLAVQPAAGSYTCSGCPSPCFCLLLLMMMMLLLLLLLLLGVQRLLGHHYVEQLDCMVFFNPPLVVWGLWHSMKGLLPDATRAKIKFVGPGDTHELQEVVPQQVRGRGAANVVLQVLHCCVRVLDQTPQLVAGTGCRVRLGRARFGLCVGVVRGPRFEGTLGYAGAHARPQRMVMDLENCI